MLLSGYKNCTWSTTGYQRYQRVPEESRGYRQYHGPPGGLGGSGGGSSTRTGTGINATVVLSPVYANISSPWGPVPVVRYLRGTSIVNATNVCGVPPANYATITKGLNATAETTYPGALIIRIHYMVPTNNNDLPTQLIPEGTTLETIIQQLSLTTTLTIPRQ